jgi:hypothetical protein
MQRTTAALLGAAVFASAVVVPTPAFAHDLPPNVLTVLDGVSPRTPGVTVQVTRSVADQLVVQNTTPNDLEVLAPTGEPFLRIGPHGVDANLNSPSWYLSSSVEGTVGVPPRARAGVPPEWAHLSTANSFGWFDHRLHPATIPAPRGKKSQRLLSWTVPMRLNGLPMTARGHLQFVVPKGTVVARVDRATVTNGVSVGAAPGRVPALFLRVTPGHSVEVAGEGGEPMVRVTNAAVEANEASPTWRFTAASKNQVPAGVVDAGAPPRWVPVSRAGSVSWLEPRARYPRGEPPASIQRRRKVTTLAHWRVPVTVDGQRHDIEGTLQWAPAGVTNARHSPRGGSWRVPLIAVAVIVVGGLLVARARTRRGRMSP